MTISNKPGWEINADGWLLSATRIPSQNFDARPVNEISLIVIHAISLPPGKFDGTTVIEFFTNRLDATAHPYFSEIAAQRVSAHFFLPRDGRIIQLVSCLDRAWHAGISCWYGRERCNDFSIGIELEGDDDTPYTEAQYIALSYLIQTLRDRFEIRACIGHADIAPGRKTDPGPYFMWSRIA